MGAEDSVAALKRKLWRVHGIPPHQQVLRLGGAAGRLLQDDAQTLPAAGVAPGMKVMLLGHAGLYPGMDGGGERKGDPKDPRKEALGAPEAGGGGTDGESPLDNAWHDLERACVPAGPEVEDTRRAQAEARVAELRRQGNERFQAGEHSGAARLYTKALGLAAAVKGRHLLHSNRAACRLALGDVPGALADAKEAVSLSPTFARGFSRLGSAYLRLGRWNEAQFAFERGLQLEPQDPALVKGEMEAAAALHQMKV